MTFSRKKEKMSLFFSEMYWQDMLFVVLYWCLCVQKCRTNRRVLKKIHFCFWKNFLSFSLRTDQNFGRIFGFQVLKCVLLNKSNKKNKAKCSNFGERNGKCFLTKVLPYDIMLIQESETMRFRILCCLEMSKKQIRLWRSPRIPHRRQRRVQFIIDTPIPDGISINFILWGYDLGKESKWISRKWVQKLFLCSCLWSCSSAFSLLL